MKKLVLIWLSLVAFAVSVFADASTYLNFTAVNGAATIKLQLGRDGALWVNLQYSTDSCATWNDYFIGDSINLTSGSKVFFKALNTNEGLCNPGYGGSWLQFIMTGTVAGDGNIMSLLDATMQQDSVPAFCFYNLFCGCSSLIKAPYLPATKLAQSCYSHMFYGCSSLTQAPMLPATTLHNYCYSSMFKHCTSLTQAPSLPATTLATECYSYMFENCSSLVKVPTLPATTLAYGCYMEMFYGCLSLTQIPQLPASILASYCYYLMFGNCSSLIINTNTPGVQWTIPATTVSDITDALRGMFDGTGGTMNSTPFVNTTYYVVPSYNVIANSSNDSVGSVAGSGTYRYGNVVMLTAEAIDHYHFVRWSDGSTNNPRNVTITSDTTITAIFEIDKHTLSTNTSHCTISGLGTYNYGDTVTLTVVPDEHFYFQKWTDGIVSESRSVLVDTDKVYDVVLMADSFDIMTNAQYGSVTGDGRYGYLDLVQLTATPDEGYRFTGWSDGSEYNPYIFEAVEDVTLEAYFEEVVAVETVSESVEFYYSNGWLYNPEGVRLYLYSTEGKLVKTGNADIDMTGLPEGVYFVRDTQNRHIKIFHKIQI